jgi:hypothetical protein
MSNVHFNAENALPHRDGDFTPYVSDVARASTSFKSRQILWVNGTQNTPDSHKDGGLSLSAIAEGVCLGDFNEAGTLGGKSLSEYVQDVRTAPFLQDPVPGSQVISAVSAVYNAATRSDTQPATTYGEVIAKLLQSLIINDSVQGDVIQNPADWMRTMSQVIYTNDPVLKKYFDDHPGKVRQLIHLFFADNLATVGLFEFLMDNIWPMPKIDIVCHSQGNFIVSCALGGVKLASRGKLPRAVSVFALASPAPYWPQVPGLLLHFYDNMHDIVPYLSLTRSFWPATSQWVTWGGSYWLFQGIHDRHSFKTYIDPQFTLFANDLRATLGLGRLDALPSGSATHTDHGHGH